MGTRFLRTPSVPLKVLVRSFFGKKLVYQFEEGRTGIKGMDGFGPLTPVLPRSVAPLP